jgi:hypothetical protein
MRPDYAFEIEWRLRFIGTKVEREIERVRLSHRQ